MARPRKQVDEEQLEKLAMMQCTIEEIAAFFDVSHDTIQRRFACHIKKGNAKGRMSMKRALFEKMNKGDLGAMVWWGKNFAGMSDKVEQKTEVKAEQKIVFTSSWGGVFDGDAKEPKP